MFKNLTLLFLLSHIMGDFYFQSDKLAKKKRDSFSYLLWHVIIYFIVSVSCLLPFFSYELLVGCGILAVWHLFVDIVKRYFSRKKKTETLLYIIDQLLHISAILIVSFVLLGIDLCLKTPLDKLFSFSDVLNFYRWLSLLLFVGKPANITIKQLLENYKPKSEDEPGIKNAGAFIGILERIIILLFLSIQQFSAIGLVLTAKSIARYNKIAEDKQFAEYYLLGTLLSTLFVIAAYLLLAA